MVRRYVPTCDSALLKATDPSSKELRLAEKKMEDMLSALLQHQEY